MHVLCTGRNCVEKEKNSSHDGETGNKVFDHLSFINHLNVRQ